MTIEREADSREKDTPPTTTAADTRVNDNRRRPLSEAAERALAEASARRQKVAAARPREVDGRGGLEPVRYGDWEIKGLASDF